MVEPQTKLTEKDFKDKNFRSKSILKNYDHATPALKQPEWIKIDDECVFDLCVLVFKILNNQLPSWLYSFVTVSEIRGTYTRLSNNLFVSITYTTTDLKIVALYYGIRFL